jgi:hypothetical protein
MQARPATLLAFLAPALSEVEGLPALLADYYGTKIYKSA